MDYVDYKNFIYATWKHDKKSHRNRLDAILTSTSNRIDNKPSEHHYTAPCKHKKILKADRNIVADNEKYQNSIKEILNKDKYKEIKTQIEKMNGLGCIKKNLKKSSKYDTDDENWRFYNKLSNIKSQFSIEKWNKDFKKFSDYRKLIAKPHLEKKNSHSSSEIRLKRTLIDSYSLAYFN